MKKQAVLTAVAGLLTFASVAVLPAFAQDTGARTYTPTSRGEYSNYRWDHERHHGKGDGRGYGYQRYGYGSYGKDMPGKDMYGKDRYQGYGSYDKGSYGSYDKGSYGNYGKGGYGNYGYGYSSPRMSR